MGAQPVAVRVENSFIFAHGVGETTERQLWREGILHWDDVPTCSVVSRRKRGAICEFADRARDELDAGNVPFFDARLPGPERWRLADSFREQCCYLDIETTGLDHYHDVVTTVSIHQNDETTTLIRGDDLTRDRLEAELAAAGLLVTFNGISFDVPFLETAFDLSIDVPHLDLRYPAKRLELTGGLKRIEQLLGIERDLPDIDGREAVELWYRHERGEDGALETLVRYNRDDTRNLETLLDVVVRRLDEQVYVPHIPADVGGRT